MEKCGIIRVKKVEGSRTDAKGGGSTAPEGAKRADNAA